MVRFKLVAACLLCIIPAALSQPLVSFDATTRSVTFANPGGGSVRASLKGPGVGNIFAESDGWRLELAGSTSATIVTLLGNKTDTGWRGLRANDPLGSVTAVKLPLRGIFSARSGISKVVLSGASNAVVACAHIDSLSVSGDFVSSMLLAGVDLGADHHLGGSDDAADITMPTIVKSVLVLKRADNSIIAAGYDLIDGIPLNQNDQILPGSGFISLKLSGASATTLVFGETFGKSIFGQKTVTPANTGNFITPTKLDAINQMPLPPPPVNQGQPKMYVTPLAGFHFQWVEGYIVSPAIGFYTDNQIWVSDVGGPNTSFDYNMSWAGSIPLSAKFGGSGAAGSGLFPAIFTFDLNPFRLKAGEYASQIVVNSHRIPQQATAIPVTVTVLPHTYTGTLSGTAVYQGKTYPLGGDAHVTFDRGGRVVDGVLSAFTTYTDPNFPDQVQALNNDFNLSGTATRMNIGGIVVGSGHNPGFILLERIMGATQGVSINAILSFRQDNQDVGWQ